SSATVGDLEAAVEGRRVFDGRIVAAAAGAQELGDADPGEDHARDRRGDADGLRRLCLIFELAAVLFASGSRGVLRNAPVVVPAVDPVFAGREGDTTGHARCNAEPDEGPPDGGGLPPRPFLAGTGVCAGARRARRARTGAQVAPGD